MFQITTFPDFVLVFERLAFHEFLSDFHEKTWFEKLLPRSFRKNKNRNGGDLISLSKYISKTGDFTCGKQCHIGSYVWTKMYLTDATIMHEHSASVNLAPRTSRTATTRPGVLMFAAKIRAWLASHARFWAACSSTHVMVVVVREVRGARLTLADCSCTMVASFKYILVQT